ncbi:putative sporulation protein YyaC [Thermanaeromonas toyohensis ToBE]|uniref:Putative sporulation protein YyaC n=1 Tax=Thermanaeromonas toyohensis ToBE TaxID=698762 RepID=A0A1W1W512_9FIRM|nr:spore protease YyaC [Thermanaeromonas toyohensis]SMC00174.1 putative sporulation protein YyaC [Thermanaeromonas toyohensis ToBE]
MVTFPFISRHFPDDFNLLSKLKYHYQDPLVVEKLSSGLKEYLSQLNPDHSRPLVVMGIGTDRSTGDSLGPLVGSKLVSFPDFPASVYGTLEDPVHASNLSEKLDLIRATYPHPFIIAVDACLGQADSVGTITLSPGALKPGAGVNKVLPAVGDIHFTGIVNVGGYMEYFVLQNTRLSLVMRMAERIALAIYHGVLKAYGLNAYPAVQGFQ